MLQTLDKTPLSLKRSDLPRVPHHYRPAHHEILVLELVSDQYVITLTGVIRGVFIHALTGQPLYRYSFDLGDGIAYARASALFPGQYYVVRQVGERFACSCYQSRLCGTCQCSEEVRRHVESREVYHVG